MLHFFAPSNIISVEYLKGFYLFLSCKSLWVSDSSSLGMSIKYAASVMDGINITGVYALSLGGIQKTDASCVM